MNHEELLKQTPEQLVTIIEGLNQTFAGKEQELQAANKNIEELKKKVTDTTKELGDVKKELASTVKVNAELSKTIEQLPKKEASQKEPGFTVDGVKYGFAFHHTVFEGKNITVDDVIADKELQAKLVSRNIGMIRQK